MKILKPLVPSLVFCLLQAVIPNAHATQITTRKATSVRYKVVSQRWLTTEELKQFDDVFGNAIAVRMRLSLGMLKLLMVMLHFGWILKTKLQIAIF